MGDKFNVLDKDGDGQLSAEELKQAIVKLLKRNYSLEEAEALVNNLDNDKDGKSKSVALEFSSLRLMQSFPFFSFSFSLGAPAVHPGKEGATRKR